jgi:hypothetical protein
MSHIPLLGGAYQAKSLIANAQRCINLYPEITPEKDQPPVPVAHYPTPGLDLLISGPSANAVRCTYRASNGDLYRVVGNTVYYVRPDWQDVALGIIGGIGVTTPISMADNGLVIVIVDGSPHGYAIEMDTRAYGKISDPNFYGATRADYLDTFLLFNRPNTSQWYISMSNCTYSMLTGVVGSIVSGSITSGGSLYTDGTYTGVSLTGGSGTGAVATVTVSASEVSTVEITTPGANYLVGDILSATAASIGGTGSGFTFAIDTTGGNAFDSLDIAAKTGYPDNIVSLVVVHREIWLIGTLTTEIWANSGAADFTFQPIPGAFVQHGSVAPYSVAAQDLSAYWLAEDEQGQAIVLAGSLYRALRISTHAIEQEISSYQNISDAIGFIYQQQGHTFYLLVFPSANRTWVYDMATELWHERAWTDDQGNLNRHRANCVANAYGKIVVGDWENGNLYAFNTDTYTDNGDPISRIRSFPHLVKGFNRLYYNSFIADMQVGFDDGTIDGSTPSDPPVVSLRFSSDRGASYGNKMEQSMGAAGQYLTSMQWNRIGMARDAVFELSWSAPAPTALQGAWIRVKEGAT